MKPVTRTTMYGVLAVALALASSVLPARATEYLDGLPGLWEGKFTGAELVGWRIVIKQEGPKLVWEGEALTDFTTYYEGAKARGTVSVNQFTGEIVLTGAYTQRVPGGLTLSLTRTDEKVLKALFLDGRNILASGVLEKVEPKKDEPKTK